MESSRKYGREKILLLLNLAWNTGLLPDPRLGQGVGHYELDIIEHVAHGYFNMQPRGRSKDTNVFTISLSLCPFRGAK